MACTRDNNCATHQKRCTDLYRQWASKVKMSSNRIAGSTISTLSQTHRISHSLLSYSLHISLSHPDKTINDKTRKNQLSLSCACSSYLKYPHTCLIMSCSASNLHIESRCRPRCSPFHNYRPS